MDLETIQKLIEEKEQELEKAEGEYKEGNKKAYRTFKVIKKELFKLQQQERKIKKKKRFQEDNELDKESELKKNEERKKAHKEFYDCR